MPTKEIQPDPRQLAPIEDALFQARAGLEVLSAAIDRLISTAFTNPPLAHQRLARIVRHYDVGRAADALEDPSRHIGFLHGNLFRPHVRRAARAAVPELVTKLREADQLQKRVSDLQRARQALFERADRTRLEEMNRARHRPRERKR